MKKGLIYVEQVSERIKYVEYTFFESRGLDVRFTNDRSFFATFSGERLSYSPEVFNNASQLFPSSLLFRDSLEENKVEPANWRDLQVLAFNDFPDPLATMFYCVTRYEEYFPSVRDEHDRYLAKNSILTKHFNPKEQIVERIFHRFLEVFFLEIYLEYKDALKSELIPTFDIDNTFAYKWKEGWRTWLSVAKDRLNNSKNRLETRRKVQAGEISDPYDSFDKIREITKRFPATKIFWLLGDFKKYDKNISWADPRHQRMIRDLNTLTKLGLHPSYASNLEPVRVEMEKRRLAQITGNEIHQSRQHFLKLTFPQTYKSLVSAGFTHDYSMGYAEQVGFRAGTAHPFHWFDLQANKTTNLTVHPFAYMDGTLNQYLKLNPDSAILEITALIDEVKKYGGEFSFIWHNETLAESGIWRDWSAVFDATINYWNETN